MLQRQRAISSDFSDDELGGDATDVLVERVENYVIAFKGEEGTSLFRTCTMVGGQMSRQPNDQMTSHRTPLEMDDPSQVP